MQPTQPELRQAGRVLVIDPAGRVLLLEGFDPVQPDRRYWVTIGGGLDDGESSAQAAVRELREEAGIVAAAGELAGPVWQRSTEFSFDGRWYRQEEDYYLLRVGRVTVSLAGLDDIERRTVTGYRWWSHEELAATAVPFYPAELPDLLRRFGRSGGTGSTPQVHLLAGLNGAGKTTFARHLEADLPAVRFTLDEWMLRLHNLRYDDPAYPVLAESCKSLIWDTALQVLKAGVDVVLDWNQWSRQRRAEWAAKARAHGFEPVLHYVRICLDTAIAQASVRNARDPAYAHTLDAAAVRHLASIFEEPSEDEDLHLQIISD
jgi:predicted kinase/8-oxo-dGTP pyrophosphatase MutT (NUDIX family)